LKGIGSYSKSFNDYETLERGFTRVETVNAITADWVATRPSPTSYEWTIRQLSGADWGDLNNYGRMGAGDSSPRRENSAWIR